VMIKSRSDKVEEQLFSRWLRHLVVSPRET
jgi:hypothetical protein